jgi:hypothetical protein
MSISLVYNLFLKINIIVVKTRKKLNPRFRS